MYYTTTDYKNFEENYNFFAHFHKIVTDYIPQLEFKISKDLIEKLDREKLSIGTNEYYPEGVRDLCDAIQIHLINNDYVGHFLPLRAIKINNRTSMGALLKEGIKEQLEGRSESEKIAYLGSIITYIYTARRAGTGVRIHFDNDLQDTSIAVIDKISKYFVPEKVTPSTEHVMTNYDKIKKLFFTPETEDFNWYIQEDLVIKRWDDEAYVLSQVSQSSSNIAFIDKSLFENNLFNEKLAKIIFSKIEPKSSTSFWEQLEITREKFKEISPLLFKGINDFEDKKFFKDNINYVKALESYHKTAGLDSQYFKLFITSTVNNLKEGETISSLYQYIDYIDRENIVKPYILMQLENPNSWSTTLLENIYNRYPDIEDREYFLNIMKLKSQQYFSHDYMQPLKKFLKNCTQEDFIEVMNISASTLSNYMSYMNTVGEKPFDFSYDYDFCEQLLSAVEAFNNEGDNRKNKAKILQFMLTPEFIDKNVKRIYNYSLSGNWYILSPDNLQKVYNDTAYMKDLLKSKKLSKNHEEEYFKFISPTLLEPKSFDIELFSLFSFPILEDSIRYNEAMRARVNECIKQLNYESIQKLLERNSLNYLFLTHEQKIDTNLATQFIEGLNKGSNLKEKYFGIIPPILMKNKDLYLLMIGSAMQTNLAPQLLKKCPKEFWNNKEFILKICSMLDNSNKSDSLIQTYIAAMPQKIQEFFKKFDMKKGDYQNFLSMYILKQELNQSLQVSVSKPKINKL